MGSREIAWKSKGCEEVKGENPDSTLIFTARKTPMLCVLRR